MSGSLQLCRSFLAVAIVMGWLHTAEAQTLKDKVGYTALVNEYGAGLATGAGVRVGLVEADVDTNTTIFAYLPNTASSEFSGKSFFDLSNQQTATTSSHATAVAGFFFGNSSSFSPGVNSVDLYEANHFVDVLQRPGTAFNPDPTHVSVLNHSYIGFGLTAAEAAEVNARLDYTVTRDNVTSVAALNNGVGTVPQLYGQTYNSIVVGRSDGLHSFGTTTVNGAGRTKPDIVAPQSATSFATPSVSSAAALLHSAAANSGMIEARNSEAMKAIIMAGATKEEFPGWSNTSTRPLDSVYGAGELNV